MCLVDACDVRGKVKLYLPTRDIYGRWMDGVSRSGIQFSMIGGAVHGGKLVGRFIGCSTVEEVKTRLLDFVDS